MSALLEHAAQSLVVLTCAHGLCCALLTNARVRWFAMHAMINTAIAACTAPAVWRLPEQLTHHTYDFGALCTHAVPAELRSRFPIVLTVYMHAWHALFFKLTRDDVIHHALFVMVLAVPGAVYEWGMCGNLCLFWVCGLPGGAIYALLALQKCGFCGSLHEPVLTHYMNSLLRAPGVLSVQPLLWHALVTRRTDAPVIAVLAQLLLAPFNAIFYALEARKRMHRKLR